MVLRGSRGERARDDLSLDMCALLPWTQPQHQTMRIGTRVLAFVMTGVKMAGVEHHSFMLRSCRSAVNLVKGLWS